PRRARRIQGPSRAEAWRTGRDAEHPGGSDPGITTRSDGRAEGREAGLEQEARASAQQPTLQPDVPLLAQDQIGEHLPDGRAPRAIADHPRGESGAVEAGPDRRRLQQVAAEL